VRVLVVNAGSSSLKLRLLGAAYAIECSATCPRADGLDTPAWRERRSSGSNSGLVEQSSGR